jgi:hypothetical protein
MRLRLVVAGLVDDAHATAPDLFEQFVVAEIADTGGIDGLEVLVIPSILPLLA